MHISLKMDTPIEFINIIPYNPLISKCEIKVCYVDDKPNRNKTVITKEVAKQMANSLPGCPIVGFFNEGKADYEEHNKIIEISGGELILKENTKPIGFVDLNAKVWFQKFLDDGEVEREYMMTEGWLWTGQYPESERILKLGNNQSMELDSGTLKGSWANSENDKFSFLIINEAIISKLCVLGQDVEPCFEGASIGAPTIQFSLEEDFKNKMFSMMNELKELLSKGGEKVFTKYDVEIGDSLWNALYAFISETYERIDGVFIEEEQKFAVLFANEKYYRLNIGELEDGSFDFSAEPVILENYVLSESPQFSPEAVESYRLSLISALPQENTEDKIVQYNLDEIQEYIELSHNYSVLNDEHSALQLSYQEALNTIEIYKQAELDYAKSLEELKAAIEAADKNYKATIDDLQARNQELSTFKADIEKARKMQMIDSFYMLSDEDKAEVIANVDNYSLEDIEAKLSVICVRKKVNFSYDSDNSANTSAPTNTTVNLDFSFHDEVPDWVKALRSVAQDY